MENEPTQAAWSEGTSVELVLVEDLLFGCWLLRVFVLLS
jgi:hypothetical protein